MKLFVPISKVDEEQRMVYGYASTEALDSQGERVSKAALEKALPDYMKYANIREMHQPSAVGVAKEADIDDKGLFIGVKVVDGTAWEKVKEKVYKGFSIGGRMLAKLGDTITDLTLTEISLVDRPANPEALISVWKVDGAEQLEQSNTDPASAVDVLADMLTKGEITPERLIELAKADIQPKQDPQQIETPAAEDTAKADKIDPPEDEGGMTDDEEGEQGEDARKSDVAAIKKMAGLGLLQHFASVLGLLEDLRQHAAWEAEMEGDNSPIPAKLKDAVNALADILVEAVGEEIAELKAGTEVAMADAAGDVSKAGAKFSAETKKALGELHGMIKKCDEHMGKMGYADDAEKAEVLPTDATETVAKTDLGEDLKKAMTENAALKKRVAELESQPEPPKGAVRAVEKAADAAAVATEPEPEPTDPLAAVKKAMQAPNFIRLS